MSRKFERGSELTPGNGAFQDNGTPAALTAFIVKNATAATLRIVVRIAIRLTSILKRLKTRRTASLCSARAASTPIENK